MSFLGHSFPVAGALFSAMIVSLSFKSFLLSMKRAAAAVAAVATRNDDLIFLAFEIHLMVTSYITMPLDAHLHLPRHLISLTILRTCVFLSRARADLKQPATLGSSSIYT